MNELFPIVRRKRRPLVEDAPPMMVGNVEPPKVEAGINGTDATEGTGTHDEPPAHDEKVANQ